MSPVAAGGAVSAKATDWPGQSVGTRPSSSGGPPGRQRVQSESPRTPA